MGGGGRRRLGGGGLVQHASGKQGARPIGSGDRSLRIVHDFHQPDAQRRAGLHGLHLSPAPAGKGFYRSEVEPSLAVNWTAAGVKIMPKAYYDVVEKGATYELNAAAALPRPPWGRKRT